MTEYPQLPRRSEAGLASMDVFFRSFNDFNFYVEDENQENFYFEVLKKKFPGVRIEKVFPLGGKCAVIAHAKDPSNMGIGHRVYLLDKDFDDLLGKVENVDGVFYLDYFCIENYLIDPAALVEIVVECHPKLKREEIASTLKLDEVLPRFADSLRDLFALFYIVQLEDLGLPNCREAPEKFCRPKALWELEDDLVSLYRTRVNELLSAKGRSVLSASLRDDARLSAIYASEAFQVISGKFWLHLILHYLRGKFNLGSSTFYSFAFRLAKNSDLTSLDNLRARVLSSFAGTGK